MRNRSSISLMDDDRQSTSTSTAPRGKHVSPLKNRSSVFKQEARRHAGIRVLTEIVRQEPVMAHFVKRTQEPSRSRSPSL